MVLAAAVSQVLRVHRTWAIVVMSVNGFVGAWALLAWFVNARLRHRAFWVASIVALSAIAIQVGLGITLYALGARANNFHVFYGVLLVVTPTLGYIYHSEPAVKKRIWMWAGLFHLFLMGLAIRAYLKAS